MSFSMWSEKKIQCKTSVKNFDCLFTLKIFRVLKKLAKHFETRPRSKISHLFAHFRVKKCLFYEFRVLQKTDL